MTFLRMSSIRIAIRTTGSAPFAFARVCQPSVTEVTDVPPFQQGRPANRL
jgi:hypothetical protein